MKYCKVLYKKHISGIKKINGIRTFKHKNSINQPNKKFLNKQKNFLNKSLFIFLFRLINLD